MLDWQTATVILITLCAALYVARRAWTRLRAFRASKTNMDAAASCETGCGQCPSSQGQKAPAAAARTVFVEIGRARTKPGRS
jgi:hypothetical protein